MSNDVILSTETVRFEGQPVRNHRCDKVSKELMCVTKVRLKLSLVLIQHDRCHMMSTNLRYFSPDPKVLIGKSQNETIVFSTSCGY